ncbi:MAG: tRNA (adenosine(37)-N6)-dimethylallyltransferase MiaA [Actinomycetales bacterium]
MSASDPDALPVIAVVGPTGSGKSELGVRLALELGGEVINADSMQFYRGMDIGTAKTPLSERRGIPHHLLDILEVTEETSVAAFQEQSRALISAVRSRGNVPILVGGSGLYVRAALDRLEFPGTDPRIRGRLEAELARHGFDALHRRLAAVDAVSARRIGDGRRVVRALEVFELSGRPFSSFMPERDYFQPAVQLALAGERSGLHERLAARVRTMVADGLQEEVAALAAAGLRAGRTASRALGYQQFLRVLDGTSTAAAAAEETIIATRQYARRQLTWFRADPRVAWLPSEAPGLLGSALAAVRNGYRRLGA